MRKSAVRIAFLVALSAVSTLLPIRRGHCSGDNWYADVDGHWATHYIYLLWEEDVTDGERSATKEHVFYYFPDDKVTRAQLATLLFKVFQLPPMSPDQPSYPDVPKDYCMSWGKPAWQFIEGALSGGISFVPPGARFLPDRYATREDAVDFLIRSLDLEDYANSLTPAEVQTILRIFWDWQEVSPNRRAAVACAVKLGIIDGYKDWSLRPLRYMSRAEAATVVCRSCLIRVSARGDGFSPDGDGIDDVIGFDLTYLKNRGIRQWQVVIASESGTPVQYFNWDSTSGQPPLYLVWDGRDLSGTTVPRGVYYYNGWIKDTRGRVFSSVVKPLYVEVHSLSAWLSPERCLDNQTLTVRAVTVPKAASVAVSFAGGTRKDLSTSDGGSSWQAQAMMGPSFPVGHQEAVVTAVFPGAVRSVRLTFERVEDVWLFASVEPNPASWGQTLTLACQASPSIRRVSVSLFGLDREMSESPSGGWLALADVPWSVQEGVYPATFTGFTERGRISATVMVDVRSPEVAKLIYILSK